MYNPRLLPTSAPPPLSDWKSFLGCLDKDNGAQIRVQYQEYYEEQKQLHEEDRLLAPDERKLPKIDTVSYWEENRERWPLLAKVALWHMNFPTSNIPCERVGAILRMVESDWSRNRMAHDTVRREVKFKVNRWVLEDALQRTLQQLSAL